jgi:hypothetical protein
METGRVLVQTGELKPTVPFLCLIIDVDGDVRRVRLPTENIGEVYHALGDYLREHYPALLFRPVFRGEPAKPPIAGGSHDLSLPGEPSRAEIEERAQAILVRVKQLSTLLAAARVPADATTACAFVVLGTSILCLPPSPIAPEFVDALVDEMRDLGKAHGRALTIQLRARANGGA